MIPRRRFRSVLGPLLISLWFVLAWIRLLPPSKIRETLYHGVNRVISFRARVHVTIFARHETPVFHWLLTWRHTVVIAPQLARYHHWAYAHLAYSDVLSLYGAHQLFSHALPYITTPIEYPVLLGVFMWLAAWVPTVTGYFLVTGIALYIAAMGTYVHLSRRNPRLSLIFAATPLLLFYGLLNWDIFGIFLMVLAIDRYEGQCYDAAAVLFALAVFFKFFPIFYLPFVVIDLLRRGQSRIVKRGTGLFVVISLAINLPFIIGNWWNWSIFYVFNASRGLGADIWSNHWLHMRSTSLIDIVSLLVVLGIMVVSGWKVGRGMSVYQAAALTFAAFLIVNKVYSPQYTLWMVVYASFADWPTWTVVAMGVMGVLDYVNSFTVLRLISEHRGAWYAGHLFPWGIALRYLTLAATLVSALIRRSRARLTHRISFREVG